jgi:hypothetical protein
LIIEFIFNLPSFLECKLSRHLRGGGGRTKKK